jgi:hypothetical protein
MRAMLAVLLFAASAGAASPAWTPATWADESTLQLGTTVPGEQEHWFPVWLAVVDDQLYVRLGARAVGRVEHNVTAPFVGVRVGGQEFAHARGVPAPEQAARVAAVMAQKYWSDVLVRRVNHPLTLRLLPE